VETGRNIRRDADTSHRKGVRGGEAQATALAQARRRQVKPGAGFRGQQGDAGQHSTQSWQGLAWTSCPTHRQRINVARTELIGRAHLDEEV
jgi:hypothetical protein